MRSGSICFILLVCGKKTAKKESFSFTEDSNVFICNRMAIRQQTQKNSNKKRKLSKWKEWSSC